VERKLSNAEEFQRFVGRKAKIMLRHAIDNQRHWTGTLTDFREGVITLDAGPGKRLQFPLTEVERANLKFEW
jgi:ribosome maturation factor RimP